MTDHECGTWNGYNHYGCRTPECRAAGSAYLKARRLDIRLGLLPKPKRRAKRTPLAEQVAKRPSRSADTLSPRMAALVAEASSPRPPAPPAP